MHFVLPVRMGSGEGGKMEKRIGAQLYTVRDYMKTIEEFDQTCRRIHDIGYQIVV